MTEHTLQLLCIAEFRNRLERYEKGIVIPVPNELAAKRKDVIICEGCSDLILALENKTIYCELKVGYNSQQDNQIDFEKRIKKLGHEYHVIKSLRSFIQLIQCYENRIK